MATTCPERRFRRPPEGASDGDPVLLLRELETGADYAACAAMQRRVWGEEYRDLVPGSLIKASREVGGLCAGAFDGNGNLVGFVYGLTGVRGGRIAHWSHMLAVEPAYRDRGVGRRLKAFQREALQAAGVEMMYWTFDPLVARNAHLNLNRLGVSIEGYVEEMYPDTGSDLHAFGTDRLVASWPVAREPSSRPGPVDVSAIPAWSGAVPPPGGAVLVAIPADAESMRESRLDELRSWRRSTRTAFMTLLEAGCSVTAFVGGDAEGRYVVRRPT